MAECIFINRYRVKFTFKDVDETTVLMSSDDKDAFSYMRYGFPNDYTAAYSKYLEDIEALKTVMPHTKDQFEKLVHSEESPLRKMYCQLVVSDMTKIDMIDPSGGPYITVGTDLSKWIFKDKNRRVVESIDLRSEEGSILFKISKAN